MGTIRNSVTQATQDLERDAPMVSKAPMLPPALVGALELLVCSGEEPFFLRFFAWFRLVKVWAVAGLGIFKGLIPTRGHDQRLYVGSHRRDEDERAWETDQVPSHLHLLRGLRTVPALVEDRTWHAVGGVCGLQEGSPFAAGLQEHGTHQESSGAVQRCHGLHAGPDPEAEEADSQKWRLETRSR